MAKLSSCPEIGELRKLASGELSSPQFDTLAGHLETCPACLSKVQTISPTSMIEQSLSKACEQPEGPDAEVVARLIGKLKQRVSSSLWGTSGGTTNEQTVEATLVATPGQEPASKSPSLSNEDTTEIHSFLSAPQSPDELGRLGGYRILRVLGKGGMGLVFEAEDPGLERRVALKVMKFNNADDDRSKKRFLSEARLAAKVQCDHVVTIYQVGEDKGVPFLAMEVLQGQSLDDLLKKKNPLDLSEVLRLGREIAQGLAAAHEKNLIHRDIKPANIWVEPSGRVKILDFGLARPVERDANLTSSGSIVGTPAYMAPEQARGEKVDARADLFSLGCVMYRLVTGSMAFKGESAMDVLVSLATKTPQPVAELSPRTPPALVTLIHRLLSKDREKRPTSAQEVVEAIRVIEEHQPQLKSKSFPPRRKLLVPALAVAMLALIAVAGIVYFMQTPQGTIRIEIDDPAIEVTLAKTRATIKGVDKHEIKLEPGEHGFTVKRGDLEFQTDKFILKKGETVTLRVEFLQGKVLVAKADGKLLGERKAGEPPPPPDPPVAVGTDFALSFGKEAFVELPTLEVESAGPLTFEAFVTPRTVSGVYREVLGFAGGSKLLGLHMLGKWAFWWEGGTGPSNLFGEPAVVDRRAHVAAVVESRRLRIYTDGRQSGPEMTLDPASGTRRGFRLGFGLEGNLDEVRISNCVRYRANFTPAARCEPDANTLALYHCDEGSGKILKDSSGNNHHGKIVGAKWVMVEGSPSISDAWEKSLAAMPPAKQVEAVVAKLKELNPGFDGKVTHKSMDGMVTELEFLTDSVSDISPVRALKYLRKLNCGGSAKDKGQLSDLSPLKDLPLTYLECHYTKVDDLSPLKKMKLTYLGCGATAVSDLSPLKDMPLTSLSCSGTLVSDLSPLKGLPLTSLQCHYSRVSDLTPLVGMPLKDLYCTLKGKKDLEILRSIKTLEKISSLPAAEFWKKVETTDQVVMTPLFNNKDLKGWSTEKGGEGNWKVVDGALTCSGTMSHLFTDRDDYGDFHLRVEVKINETGNSGIYFRTAKPHTPIGDYEAQISNVANQQKTGSLYELSIVRELLVEPDTWFTLEIIARGDRLQVLINGKQTADYTETRPERRRKGHIVLQHHDEKTEVHFRKIEVTELNPDTMAPPNDAKEFESSKFKFFPKVLSWKEAKAACEAMGGRLAVVDTKEKDAFLFQLLKDSGGEDAWLGATDEVEEGVWVWLNGKKMEYSNWGPGQPNNKGGEEHYLLMPKRPGLDGNWSDQPLKSTQHTPGFICEWQTPSRK